LPFGAALAGWLLRKKIIYHIHEHYIRPNIMQIIAISVMRLTASKVIFVSKYLQKETLIKQPSTVLPNSLSTEFCTISNSFLHSTKNQKRPLRNVLMVSSLKTYKGVLIFLDLARNLPDYQFCLVAGTSPKEVTEFKKKHSLSKNLIIYSEQSNLHPFYQNADLILNLTIPEYCIETFGLTILEGMAYSLPAIVPPVGGPAELVKNDVNGYLINSNETEKLTSAIRNIFENKEIYHRFSQASVLISKNYSYEKIKNQLYTIIEN
jgi:glycosyltransferase involved in cell wall biosynthesis